MASSVRQPGAEDNAKGQRVTWQPAGGTGRPPGLSGDVTRLAMQLCALDEDEREFALDTLRRFCALSARRRP
ncbi:hypothetical protein [Thauera butanivorans]|uniref:hypothetical protein n=1 Tax=Thauera butanivorans TaxID=86174 RepID=UPI000838A8C5|nr:hypothetical protein [Thauera butanivorans]